MSDPIQEAKDVLAKFQSLKPKSDWSGSRLWILVAIIGGLIYLVQGNVAIILWQLTAIICVYLISHTVETVVKDNNDTKLKTKVIEAFESDKVTEAEAKVLERII